MILHIIYIIDGSGRTAVNPLPISLNENRLLVGGDNVPLDGADRGATGIIGREERLHQFARLEGMLLNLSVIVGKAGVGLAICHGTDIAHRLGLILAREDVRQRKLLSRDGKSGDEQSGQRQ